MSFQQERNLIALAKAAVHHADNGNGSLNAKFQVLFAVNILLKYEPCALAVQVKARQELLLPVQRALVLYVYFRYHGIDALLVPLLE